MSESGIPDDLQSVLDALDANEREAQRLAGGLSAGQLSWRPGNGETWSLAECLTHLYRGNGIYSAAIEQSVASADRAALVRRESIRPGWLARRFLAMTEPPVRMRIKAPSMLAPQPQPDPSVVLSQFVASHDDVRSVIRDAAALDLNRIRFVNPFLKLVRVSAGTALLIIAAHERRHLWQMKNVRDAPGFPAS